MAMISVECPDCGRVLMRLPATGGTNQTPAEKRTPEWFSGHGVGAWSDPLVSGPAGRGDVAGSLSG